MKPKHLASLLSLLAPSLLAGLPGPELVKDIYPGTYSALGYGESYEALGSTLFLAADDKVHGSELWKSDGTEAGTLMVKDLCAGPHGGGPANFMTAGNLVYFSGHDKTQGNELWRSDGTPAGTFILKDIVTGLDAGSYPRPIGAVGDTLYFSANSERTNGGDLWKTNGTPEGTVKVTTFYPAERVTLYRGVSFNGAYYFRLYRSSGSSELWRTDGTEAGTRLVSKSDSHIAATWTRLFFRNYDGVHGRELWSSDGTPEGTSMVMDIAPGGADGVPAAFIMTAGRLAYFTAQTPANPSTLALWRSDGTQAGTFPLIPLAEPVSGNFHVIGSQIYFAPKVPGAAPGIWKSDGTVAGTQPLKAGTPGGAVKFFANNDKSFYLCSALHDLLWQSDGTAQGTRVVANLYIGSSGGNSDTYPKSVNGKLLFGVYNPTTGKELYSFDTRPPSISPPVVSEVTTTGVRVEVGINPNGYSTTAKFEYGPVGPHVTKSKAIFPADGDLIWRFQDFPLELSGLTPGTTYQYTLHALSSRGSRIFTGTFRTAYTRPTWRTASFGAAASTLVSGDNQDPDGDGLNNLIEYAFGLDPNRGDVAGLPQPVSDNDNLIFEYTHPEGQDDMIYGVEWSTSMAPGSWTAVPDTGGGNHHRFVVEKRVPRVFTRWTVNPR